MALARTIAEPADPGRLDLDSPAPGGVRAWWWRQWTALDAPATGPRVPGTLIVAFAALGIGLGASLYTARTGMNLAYSDAQSHLTIARRILDGKAPGFQQLGTVWLPAPHLLLMPLSQVTVLWHTGLAAGLTGAACLMASCAALYRIAARLGLGRAARLSAVAIFVCNPSMLYAYTTALTEPVLIAAMLCAFAGLAAWMSSPRRRSAGELAVFAGIPTAIAVLSRYEGWVLVLAGTAFVAVVAQRRWHRVRGSLAMCVGFAAVPTAAMIWWLTYNWTVYGNALEFVVGPYSAAVQQQGLIDSGALPTRGNAGLSAYTVIWAVIPAAGAVLIAAAAVGAVVLVYTRGLDSSALLVWLMGVTVPFLVLSLMVGQTTIQNDHSLPSGWFNNRYALSVVPFLAILAAILIDAIRSRWRGAGRGQGLVVAGAVALALLAQNAWWLQDLSGRSAVIGEAVVSEREKLDARSAGVFLADHYAGGDILLDETQTAVLPEIGIPLSNYIFRAAGDLFDEALLRPSEYAQWVMVNRSANPNGGVPYDAIEAAAIKHPERFVGFRVVYQNDRYAVLERFTS